MNVCSALVYLHSSNRDKDSEFFEAFSHRDLKPENIMYQDGVAKLIDFGVAKMSRRSTRGTTVQGTYTWMSPEEVVPDSSKTYTLCDMFSFGLIVKWLLVGIRDDIPFKDMPTDLHITQELGRLYSRGGSLVHPYVENLNLVPPVFRLLIQYCTAIEPSKRWTASIALWELYQLKQRLAAQSQPASSLSPLAALQGEHRQSAAASRTSLPTPARSSPGAALSLLPHQTEPVTCVSSADWPSLLQKIQDALAPEAVASFKYYRNMGFAATLCGEMSDIALAEVQSMDSSHYAAASKALHAIVAGQAKPTTAEILESLFAQVKRALPRIKSEQEEAKNAGDHHKSAALQELRCALMLICAFSFELFHILQGVTH